MKTIRKITPIIGIVTISLLIIAGFFFINPTKNTSKAQLVPANANTVFYLKPDELAQDFYHLLRRDPTLLDSVSTIKLNLKELRKNAAGNGLNPLVDLLAYTFQDSATKNHYLGVFLTVINEQEFIASLTKNPETIQRNNYSTGEVIYFKDEQIVLLKNKKETLLLQPIDKNTTLSETTVTQQFDAVFGNPTHSLFTNNASFRAFAESDKHMGIWTAENTNFFFKFSSLFSILDSFGDKQVNLTANEEEVTIESIIQLKNSQFYVDSKNDSLTLSEKEIAKFSLTTTPAYLKDILEKVIAKEQHYILNYATGSLCASIIGYKKTPVYTTKIGQRIDQNTFETIEAIDTVEASPLLNIPELMYVLKINDVNELFATLNSDSLIRNEAGYWTIPHPLFINEYIYLTLKNDLLYLGTNKDFNAINPEFSTFGFIADLPKAIENYPPKNTLQRIGMAAIPTISITTISIAFDKIEANNLYLKGSIKTTDSSKHSLLILTGEALKLNGLLKSFM